MDLGLEFRQNLEELGDDCRGRSEARAHNVQVLPGTRLQLVRTRVTDSLCFSTARALPTETNVESGTSQSKSGTSVNSSNSGKLLHEGFTIAGMI